jgi:hypothetical protein
MNARIRRARIVQVSDDGNLRTAASRPRRDTFGVAAATPPEKSREIQGLAGRFDPRVGWH